MASSGHEFPVFHSFTVFQQTVQAADAMYEIRMYKLKILSMKYWGQTPL